MFKRIALIGASVATLAGAAFATAGPAAATNSTHCYSDAGCGQFYDVGEHLKACDQKADGYGILLDWYVEENVYNNGVVLDNNGANNGCVDGNLDIADNHHIIWRVCISNSGTRVACTGYFRDTA